MNTLSSVNNRKKNSVKSFKDLQMMLTNDSEGVDKFLVPHLQLGDVWWIPDQISKFSNQNDFKGFHPWVVVRPASNNRPQVYVSPRTTQYTNQKGGILTPAGKPMGLTKTGKVLLFFRRSFLREDFRYFEYIGRLPEDIIKEIVQFLKL